MECAYGDCYHVTYSAYLLRSVSEKGVHSDDINKGYVYDETALQMQIGIGKSFDFDSITEKFVISLHFDNICFAAYGARLMPLSDCTNDKRSARAK